MGWGWIAALDSSRAGATEPEQWESKRMPSADPTLTPELDPRDAEAGGTVVWMEQRGKEEEALCSSVSVFHFFF